MAGLFSKLLSHEPEEKRYSCSAIICAAGSSQRMNGENKMFLQLGGMPVILRTILAFESCADISEIIIVSRSEDIARLGSIVNEYGVSKVKCIVHGGQTRLMSVINGLDEVSKKYELVAVHDGARPLVTTELISELIEAAQVYGAAAPYIPVKDTIKIIGEGVYKKTLPRNKLAAIQTPQVFHDDIIRTALQNALVNGDEITDDAQAVELIGISPVAVRGSETNLKITSPIDMIVAETILQEML